MLEVGRWKAYGNEKSRQAPAMINCKTFFFYTIILLESLLYFFYAPRESFYLREERKGWVDGCLVGECWVRCIFLAGKNMKNKYLVCLTFYRLIFKSKLSFNLEGHLIMMSMVYREVRGWFSMDLEVQKVSINVLKSNFVTDDIWY